MDVDLIPDDLKRKSIERILSGDAFKRSGQLRRLFHWLGEEAMAGGEPMNEYEVGVRALKRSEDFDPQTDSIVRREMSRLREKLKRYYLTQGSAEPLRVDCSSGYRLQFRWDQASARRTVGGAPCLLILPIRSADELTGWATELFDELFVCLGNSEFVQLVSQTTSLRYAGRSGDVRGFAAETGADMVIEGLARRSDPVLWLVDGKSGRIRGQCLLPEWNAAKSVAEWLRVRLAE